MKKNNKHKYIDTELLHNYNKRKTYEQIEHDVINIYCVTNILDDEDAVYSICNELYLDYTEHKANYESYIEKNMNARLMMEIRKTAILPFGKDIKEVYTETGYCNTVSEVKRVREKYVKMYNPAYTEKDIWRYYHILLDTMRNQAQDLRFDFEDCYEDGDITKQTTREEYVHDMINTLLPQSLWKKIIGIPIEAYYTGPEMIIGYEEGELDRIDGYKFVDENIGYVKIEE